MIRSLYLKILMHWIGALLLTEALIFGLFVLVAGDSHRQYVVVSVGQSSLVALDLVQSQVALRVGAGEPADRALGSALARLAGDLNARVWVSDPAGRPLAASFSGPPPQPPGDPGLSGTHRGVSVSVDASKGVAWYARLPLALPGHPEPLTLHLLPTRRGTSFPTASFAAGLALIGVFIALLAVPLALRITRPLNRLQASALRIAGGDLGARAEISQADEIGRLASAFNGMAETVQRMVQSGKELTANISHEVRSPLARIRVAEECLREALARGSRDEAEEMLEAIGEDIEEADGLIGRILEYSKLDLQEPLGAAEPVAVAEVLAGMARTLGPLARSRGIILHQSLLPGETVLGDEGALRTAFKNLLENALRHTAAGGAVQVEMRREGARLAVEVTNSHAPLDPEELELIFKPFYRGRVAAGEGTGLGLAIARKAVALHQGSIGARNAPDGFQVRVELPRLEG